jgi:hypothetical protein
MAQGAVKKAKSKQTKQPKGAKKGKRSIAPKHQSLVKAHHQKKVFITFEINGDLEVNCWSIQTSGTRNCCESPWSWEVDGSCTHS